MPTVENILYFIVRNVGEIQRGEEIIAGLCTGTGAEFAATERT
jgi:hypothetical protein